ncbi:MAG: hypothetical protein M3Z25_20950 [Actinomycetota bacterium]|nr:hypothetical protein [Actinomycetota bacterium]
MPSVGLLILLVIGGAVMCVKARAAGPAAVCAGLAVLFIVSTPVGSGLPGVVATVFSAVDSAATPALNHETATTAGVRR